MKHTKLALAYRFGTCLMVAGFILLTLYSQEHISAQVVYGSQGAAVHAVDAGGASLWNAERVLPAAPEGSNDLALIGLGMLFIVIGFGLHAMLTMRNERPVPVKVKEDSTPKRQRDSRRQFDVIWIEKTIRF